MDALLANFISCGDTIVVHICGQQKTFSIKKVQEYLGLTITDNGIGRNFVKRVNSGDPNVTNMIQPGDHIALIDAESTLGKRHYEVARAIRDIPCEKTFTMTLIQPVCATVPCTKSKPKQILDDRVNSITNDQSVPKPDPPSQIYNLESDCDELINSSLPLDRLLSKGSAGGSPVSNRSNEEYRQMIGMLNTTLESLVGISDDLLAIRIYRLAKENGSSYARFSEAIKNSELSVFNFGEDIELALWNRVKIPQNTNDTCINDMRTLV